MSDQTDVSYRDAVTGEYVSEAFALAHPSTTVRETDRRDTIGETPVTVGGALNEESTMAEQPNQDLPKEEGAKGRDRAAEVQADAAARKAAKQAEKDAQAPAPNQDLP